MQPSNQRQQSSIFVRVLEADNGKSHTLSLGGWATTDQLREKIAALTGLSPNNQKLFNRNCELGSGELLLELLDDPAAIKQQHQNLWCFDSVSVHSQITEPDGYDLLPLHEQIPRRSRFLSVYSESSVDALRDKRSNSVSSNKETAAEPSLDLTLYNSQHFDKNSAQILSLFPDKTNESSLKKLFDSVRAGLKQGILPSPVGDGVSGSYFLKDRFRNTVAIFKPVDEEPYAPFNKKGLTGKLGAESIRAGIRAGECALKEYAAFLLDSEKTHGVCETDLALLTHSFLSYNGPIPRLENCIAPGRASEAAKRLLQNAVRGTKLGSLQKLARNNGCLTNISPSALPTKEVQKIALLDLRILNCDRNEQNILYSEKEKRVTLIPIDHGLALPDVPRINRDDLCWLEWPQADEPIDDQLLNFIKSMNPVADVENLKQRVKLSEESLRTFRISEEFIKMAASHKFSLREMAECYLAEEGKKSVLEDLAETAEMLNNFTIQKKTSGKLLDFSRQKSYNEIPVEIPVGRSWVSEGANELARVSSLQSNCKETRSHSFDKLSASNKKSCLGSETYFKSVKLAISMYLETAKRTKQRRFSSYV